MNAAAGPSLIEDDVQLVDGIANFSGIRCRACLHPHLFTLTGIGHNSYSVQTHRLHIADLIGFEQMQGRLKKDRTAYLSLYFYPANIKDKAGCKVRHRVNVQLQFYRAVNCESNTQRTLQWVKILKTIKNNETKRLLVFINPFGGPGKACKIFRAHVASVLAESGFSFSVIVTERSGHAREICRKLVLSHWFGIVIISGDGLIHEVVNGLMSREDGDLAIKIPIGAIPGGSGNALCAAINSAAGESKLVKFALHSSLIISRRVIRPMDLVRVVTPAKVFYSFLSFSWGLIADVDIESEKFRRLGESRFTLGAITKILGLRLYKCRLSYLDECADYDDTKLPALNERVPGNWKTVEMEVVTLIGVYLSHISADMSIEPDCRFDDGVIHLNWVKAGANRTEMIQLMSKMKSGSGVKTSHAVSLKCLAFRLEPLTDSITNMVVDGELIPHSVIQASVMPSHARIFS